MPTALVNTTAAGDVQVVAGRPGRAIRVHSLALTAGGATVIKVKSGSANDLSGPLTLGANGQIVRPFATDGYYDTVPGQGLLLNSSAAVAVGGDVTYSVLGAPMGGVAWTPANIPSLAGWWVAEPEHLYQDAARTTPVAALADPVGCWLDLSGAGRHMTQATAANRPTLTSAHSAYMLNFDATNDGLGSLALLDSHPYTIAAVWDHAGSIEANARIVNGGARNWFMGSYNGVIRMYDSAGYVSISSGSAPAANTPYVIAARNDGTAQRFRQNGVDITDSPGFVAAPGTINIGNSGSTAGPIDGRVKALVVCNDYVSDHDLRKLETYLGALLGLTI